tara:strand:+ start:100 stop:249 length:150 start_codon:yes stop_codon:yes gene_type:complete
MFFDIKYRNRAHIMIPIETILIFSELIDTRYNIPNKEDIKKENNTIKRR